MLQRNILMLVIFVLVSILGIFYIFTINGSIFSSSKIKLYNNSSETKKFLRICRKLNKLQKRYLRLLRKSKLPIYGVKNRFHCENVWNLWKETDSNFKQVNDVPDLFVYSAYFDDRTSNPALVRVNLYRNLSMPIKLTCKFIVHGNMDRPNLYTVEAVNSKKELGVDDGISEIGHDSERTYGSGFANCPIPVHINPERICHIAISTKPLILDLSIMRKINDAILPVRSTKQIKNGRKFTRGLCVKAMYNTHTIDPVKLTEFLMVNRQLGVDLIRIYVKDDLIERIKAIFSSFKSNKYCIQRNNEKSNEQDFCLFLELVAFKMPKDKAYTFAQTILEFDCLYRSMSQVKYLSYQDLDEVIIPNTRFCSVNDLLLKLDIRLEEFSGVCFRNVWFPEKLVQLKDSIPYYFADSHHAKHPLPEKWRPVCIVDTQLIMVLRKYRPSIDIQGRNASLLFDDKLFLGMAGRFMSNSPNGYYTYNLNTTFKVMKNLKRVIPSNWGTLVKQRLRMSGLLCD